MDLIRLIIFLIIIGYVMNYATNYSVDKRDAEKRTEDLMYLERVNK